MLRPCILLLAIILFASAAHAQEGNYAGLGEGELSAGITHLDSDVYAIDLSTVVPMENDMPGCAGGITGEAILSKKGGNFFVENEDYDPEAGDNAITGEQYCEIAMSFKDGELILEEGTGCLAYHVRHAASAARCNWWIEADPRV